MKEWVASLWVKFAVAWQGACVPTAWQLPQSCSDLTMSWFWVVPSRLLPAGALHNSPSEPWQSNLQIHLECCVGCQLFIPPIQQAGAQPSGRISNCCGWPWPWTGSGILPKTRVYWTSLIRPVHAGPCISTIPVFHSDFYHYHPHLQLLICGLPAVLVCFRLDTFLVTWS